jgi:hypothetical protein
MEANVDLCMHACSVPHAATWLGLRVLFGADGATVAHLQGRLPGISPFSSTLLLLSSTIDRLFTHITHTPLRLLLPHLLLLPTCAAFLLMPCTTVAAFRAREAWHRCFMDVRLTEQASVNTPSSFSREEGIAMQFGEGVWDLVRDFTADNNARAASALEVAAATTLAALVPLWLLLLSPARAAAALFALAVVLCIFGILQLHWWAEVALDELSRGAHDKATPTPHVAAAPAGTSAFHGQLITYFLLCLFPAQLFLGSGHFCEFAGVQWTAAFVGFDESSSGVDSIRSGALVAFNAFAPYAISTALLLIAAATEVHAQMIFLDGAAAEGHVLRRPLRVARGSTATSPDLSDVYTLAGAPAAAIGEADADGSEPVGSHAVRYGRPRGGSVGWLQAAACELIGLGPLVRDAAATTLSDGADNVNVFDPSWSPQQWHSAESAHAILCVALLTRVAVSALELFCASLNAYIQRRHLMIWALFAPKWMFEVSFWAVTMASLVLAACAADACVEHMLPSRSGTHRDTQFQVEVENGVQL